ncbi:NifU family protein [Kyrpidia tusciae]|uniref:Nitrogen-fixing NifU domain protein n=1 Tax=Kyrpidia tusciae (strain DSM 2912 / NBRC 15312 / T2) TaxID=562970 RepID=D5WTE3_KYRT2|nr:NifU family protein [Kyrpidia tusciae]ADG07179.1 nitrogen-fixing NifU domain protein [Kyrpidia tusciae DSM 2912]
MQLDDFGVLAANVDRAAEAIQGLSEDARQKAMEMKKAIEAFHEHALRRLVRTLRTTESGKELLLQAVEDPAVYAMFLMHGIIKQDLFTRVAAVLEEVRPYMRSHGGDVELVKVEADVVYVRLHGACSGCSLSALTLRDGVEEAVKARVPEVRRVEVAEDETVAGFIPLDDVDGLGNSGWLEGPPVELLADGRPFRFEQGGHNVLLIRVGPKIMAYRNQCPHMGMPLDKGLVEGEVLTCPWHGFRYDLSTGECLTAPHVQLEPFPVRVEEQRVWVRPG